MHWSAFFSSENQLSYSTPSEKVHHAPLSSEDLEVGLNGNWRKMKEHLAMSNPIILFSIAGYHEKTYFNRVSINIFWGYFFPLIVSQKMTNYVYDNWCFLHWYFIQSMRHKSNNHNNYQHTAQRSQVHSQVLELHWSTAEQLLNYCIRQLHEERSPQQHLQRVSKKEKLSWHCNHLGIVPLEIATTMTIMFIGHNRQCWTSLFVGSLVCGLSPDRR